jgi:hypothetical protein
MNMHAVRLATAALFAAAAGAYAAGRAADIEAVVLTSSWSPSGYGGMVVVDYRPAVLYRDGSYSTDGERALAGGRVDGRWQRSGAGYTLTDARGKSTRVEGKMRARPATRGLTLEGHYRNLAGAGTGAMGTPMVVAFKSIRFAHDGSVRMGSGGGVSGAGVVSHGKKEAVARYALDGWTITFRYPDGRREQRLFYLFPDGPRAIGVGGSTLSRR